MNGVHNKYNCRGNDLSLNIYVEIIIILSVISPRNKKKMAVRKAKEFLYKLKYIFHIDETFVSLVNQKPHLASQNFC